MIALPQHTQVLIVGAGPSGLMMAAQLLRYGVQPVIIDTRSGPTNQSKALAVQARSLEIYRQMGVIDRVLAGGKASEGVVFSQGGNEVAQLSMKNVKDAGTRFPYIFMYQQSKNERLLLDYLTTACCPVYWETSLSTLTQTEGSVNVTLQNGNGVHIVQCDYVVGADGSHSTVRKQLGIAFNGDTYQHKFFLADVKLNTSDLTPGYVHLCMGSKDFAGFFPMPEEGNYRIVANLPDEADSNEETKLEDILPHLQTVTGKQFTVEENHWFTLYKLHHRMAEKFQDRRCFLIGDAAHIHSPVGGQGMNTGLQDAYNLAWKLAGVANGRLRDTILTSYAAERMPVATELLNTTDRIFNIITSRGFLSNLLKRYVMPTALKSVWKSEKLRTVFFKRISQTGIAYRDSKVNVHHSAGTKIKASDRLPLLEIYDEKKQSTTDTHAWCSKPGFTLIVMGKMQEQFLFTLAKWLTQHYPAINFFYLPHTNTNQSLFNAFEVPAGQRKCLIVRPDMHIGYMNDVVDIGMMTNYLNEVVGFTAL